MPFWNKTREILVLGYVDDCIIAGTKESILWFSNSIIKRFFIKETPMDDFLGKRIIHKTAQTMPIDCETYIYKALNELGMTEHDKSDFLLPTNVSFRPNDGTETIPCNLDCEATSK